MLKHHNPEANWYPSFEGFLRGRCSRGGCNWGTLRIPRGDWGTLGNIREDEGNHHPPLQNPIIARCQWWQKQVGKPDSRCTPADAQDENRLPIHHDLTAQIEQS